MAKTGYNQNETIHSINRVYESDLVASWEKYPNQMLALTLQTAYLKDRQPVNVIFIAPPGIGKSTLLSSTKDLPFVTYVNDMTPKYLVKFMELVDEGKKKYLIIPDYGIMVSGHSEHTRATYQGVLRDGIDNGIMDLSSFGLEFRSKSPSGRTRFGFITAITQSSFNENAYLWRSSGFLSRLLPFSFDHTPTTQQTISDNVDRRIPFNVHKLDINKKVRQITSDPALLKQLRPYETLLADQAGSKPYRQTLQLSTFAESAVALRRGDTLEQRDIDTVADLCQYINYKFNAM